ncbi:hypothetical protein GGD65_008183 [Bradyrhizobium sp. CIR18]|uniref:hypothetical protein n=1 Tax=Bradyrhizobium sp. CIR18 TaxID=2663839 RepID=UPI001605EE1D|nr:hypothetical protein [Bradyrhizobium sp. CIR18]
MVSIFIATLNEALERPVVMPPISTKISQAASASFFLLQQEAERAVGHGQIGPIASPHQVKQQFPPGFRTLAQAVD